MTDSISSSTEKPIKIHVYDRPALSNCFSGG